MLLRLAAIVIVVSGGLALAGGDGAVKISPIVLPHLPLGVVTLAGGKAVNLSVSAGAGAYRAPSDPPGRIWTITDRGPSIDCNEERDVIGPDDKQICVTGKRGKIYLVPGFAPSIYAIDIGPQKTARFAEMIPLKGASGRPLSGLPNPVEKARPETAYGTDGQVIASDPSGIEPGALVRLKDDSFWVADGFGPSLLEVAPDGTIRRRIVPQVIGDELREADYPVDPGLPGIFALRQVGRGFDGLAVSPDEAFIFAAMTSPLMNPSQEVFRAASALRILKLDRATGKLLDQYVYELDAPDAFQGDSGVTGRPARQSDIRVMEIAALDATRLVVLERFRNLSRIYRIDLGAAVPLPRGFDDAALQPGLEGLPRAQWAAAGVVPMGKTLLFQSDPAHGPAGRLSGMAVLSEREIAVIGNNDFGIDGSRTQMFRLTFPAPFLN